MNNMIKLDYNNYSKDSVGHTRPIAREEPENDITPPKPGMAIGLDNISTELINNFGPATKKWLLRLYNKFLISHMFPKI